MAQTKTSDSPSTSATADPYPSPIQTAIPPITDIRTSPSSISTTQQSFIPQSTTQAARESDDEVQFIFSAPRRRKKKRRRIESSHLSEDVGFKVTIGVQERATPPEPPRRGTTGMVKRLESCHIGDIEGSAFPVIGRGGSLPLVPPATSTNSKSQPPAFTPSNAGKPSPQFLPFAPFMSRPWWTDLSLQLQDNPMAHNDWILMQQEDKASNKRKREPAEEPVPHPIQRAQAQQEPVQKSSSEMEGVELQPLDTLGSSGANLESTNSSSIISPASKMQNFCWIPQQKMTQIVGQAPMAATTKPRVTDPPMHNFRTSQRPPPQAKGSTRPNQHGINQKQTVTVPARLVPEQSVSPRTQTVEIPRPPFAKQSQARQIMVLQRSMVPNGQGISSPQTLNSMRPINYNNQSKIPRSIPPQTQSLQNFQRPRHTQLLNRPQTPQTYPSDITRKPSLYKVPPWPSSPSSDNRAQSPSSTSRSAMSIASPATPNLNTSNNVNPGTNGFLNLQQPKMMALQGTMMQGMQNSCPAQRMMPVTPPRTPPVQFQAQSRSFPPPSSPPPTQPQLNPNKRKNSPNLIVDIAETCQENFPFAAIAERHQTPIQKVFDTFSAIIQLPLLRSASDNRRHGSLGKWRMKEFRDARKAMEKEMKDKGADVGGGSGSGSGSGRGRKKKGPEQPLLRAALLNNASRGKD